MKKRKDNKKEESFISKKDNLTEKEEKELKEKLKYYGYI